MTTSNSTWGGPRPGSGRPPIPKHKRRSEIIHVRFTPKENHKLRKEARNAGLKLPEYIRYALFGSDSLPPVIIKCEWCSASCLKGQGRGAAKRKWCSNACRQAAYNDRLRNA